MYVYVPPAQPATPAPAPAPTPAPTVQLLPFPPPAPPTIAATPPAPYSTLSAPMHQPLGTMTYTAPIPPTPIPPTPSVPGGAQQLVFSAAPTGYVYVPPPPQTTTLTTPMSAPHFATSVTMQPTAPSLAAGVPGPYTSFQPPAPPMAPPVAPMPTPPIPLVPRPSTGERWSPPSGLHPQCHAPNAAVCPCPELERPALKPRPRSLTESDLRGFLPMSEALKDILGRDIHDVDPKAVLRKARTLRKKVRVAQYHLMRPQNELTPTERVKASRLAEFEAALVQLDDVARRLGFLPVSEAAVLQEGARLMLLAKEDIDAFFNTGPDANVSLDTKTGAPIALPDDDDDDDDGAAGPSDGAALYRKFVQSAAYHILKLRRMKHRSAHRAETR